MKMAQREIVSLSHSHRFFALVTYINFLPKGELPSPSFVDICDRLGTVSSMFAEVRDAFGSVR